jgi:hypothetical protein
MPTAFKVLAQFNHSGIASIYGLEGRAQVMELVPGPTLANRIKLVPGLILHRYEGGRRRLQA